MGRMHDFGAMGALLKPGSQIAAEMPERLSPAREKMILDYVRAGNYVAQWVPLTVSRGGQSATFWVTADAVRLGTTEDSFRPAMSHYTEQKIADELNATLLTPLLSDEVFRQAQIKLRPVPLGVENMTTMQRMLKHHNEVEKQLAAALARLGARPQFAPLVAPVGKDWVNSRRLIGRPTVNGQPAAINYGWQRTDLSPVAHTGPFPAATGYPPLVVQQSEGMAHDWGHEDYSQVARLVSRLVSVCRPLEEATSGFGALTPPLLPQGICTEAESCTMPDGRAGKMHCMDIYDVAQDPVLNVLVSHDGPVYMRHFAVPYEPPVGQHALWGGIAPTPPPQNLVEGPAAGDHPSGAPLLDPYSHPVVRAGAFAGGIALGWLLLKMLSKERG